GLASNTDDLATDIDIVMANGQIQTGVNPQCGVLPSGVVSERGGTDGRAVAIASIASQCTRTNSRIGNACRVAEERLRASGRVVVAGGAVKERSITVG